VAETKHFTGSETQTRVGKNGGEDIKKYVEGQRKGQKQRNQ